MCIFLVKVCRGVISDSLNGWLNVAMKSLRPGFPLVMKTLNYYIKSTINQSTYYLKVQLDCIFLQDWVIFKFLFNVIYKTPTWIGKQIGVLLANFLPTYLQAVSAEVGRILDNSHISDRTQAFRPRCLAWLPWRGSLLWYTGAGSWTRQSCMRHKWELYRSSCYLDLMAEQLCPPEIWICRFLFLQLYLPLGSENQLVNISSLYLMQKMNKIWHNFFLVCLLEPTCDS